MSSLLPKEGVGRGRGRGRARALQQVQQSAVVESRQTGTTSSTSSPGTGHTPQTKSGTGVADTHSDSTGSSGAVASMKDLSISKKTLNITERPDEGGCWGRPIALKTNYFIIQTSLGSTQVNQYQIQISHDYRKLNKPEMYKVFWTLAAEKATEFGHEYGCLYDGGSQLFTIQEVKLPVAQGETHEFVQDVVLPRDDRPTECKISIKWIAQHKLVFDKSHGREANRMSILIADIAYRASRFSPFIEQKFIPGGRSFYRPNDNPRDNDLGLGREIWSGYFSSAHIVNGWKPMLNLDTSHTAFYKRMPVITFMCEVLNAKLSGGGDGGGRGGRGGRGRGRGGYDDDRGAPPKWQPDCIRPNATLTPVETKVFEKEIKTLNVYATHRGKDSESVVYRVSSVTPRSAEDTMFKVRKGDTEESMSVAQYFEKTYGRLRYPNLPCLIVGSKKRGSCMPLEHCHIQYGQKCMKKLTEDMTSRMIRKACTDAPTRMNLVNEMNRESALQQDMFATKFGLQLETRMVELKGRQLEAPQLEYGRNKSVQPDKGSWDLRDTHVFKGAEIGAWGLMSFLRQDSQKALEMFCQALSRCANSMGMKMDDWPESVRYCQRAEDIETNFKMIVDEVPQQTRGRDCKLVVIALPTRNVELYAEAKRVGDVAVGVMTQCVVSRNVFAPKPQTIANIVIKINAKLGGVNNTLIDDRQRVMTKFLLGQPTLVLGIHVTHPGPLDKRSPSIGAVVGNIDLLPARFAASVKIQKHRRDAILSLTEAVKDRLQAFYRETGQKPQRIIAYRAGVSEGQFQQVLAEEMKTIREACKVIEENYQPSITFVVVQRHHHTRFFCRDTRDQCGKAKNVPPGTCVDTTIVSPDHFDFYLCSHFGIQGTSRPAHYNVLHDDSNLTSDEMQTLTYALCHMYFRCTRTVSVPAPVYYADLVAQRAKAHLAHKIGDWSDSGSVTSAGDDESLSNASIMGADELSDACRLHRSVESNMYFA